MSENESLEDIVINAMREYDSLTKDGKDCFTYEIFANYDDKLSDREIVKILDSKYPTEEFWSCIDWFYEDEETKALDETINYVAESLDRDGLLEDGAITEIEDIVRDHLTVLVPEDHYLQQKVQVDIEVDTGDMNYDFTLNQIEPAYDGTDLDTEVPKASSVRWLAETQGYTEREMREAFKGYEETGLPDKGFLPSLFMELNNVASHMNTLTILAEMTLEDLMNLNAKMKGALSKEGNRIYTPEDRPDCGTIHISKDATLGLYDSWSGGGSMFEIALEKDIDLPIKYIFSAYPDSNLHYSVKSCYGMFDSEWKDVASEIPA